ncbi:MAG TPA: ATP-dependent DNA helicase [Candidatus Paceibacterota bacterium]|nr:ATP-dependent DNA helicase [Candidatus Paceibacterota bacterium]
MPTTAAFRNAYRRLNRRQREAVDALEGPVMVIAGPGTGKTQVLTLRIANILARTDTEPRSILALTFTEKAATAMRERLLSLIGPVAYDVRIGTFHAFANEIIGRYPDAFPHIIGGMPVSDAEQLHVIERILERPDTATLRPAGRPESYVKSIIAAIGDLKGKGIGTRDFTKLAAGEPDRTRQFARVYARYGNELARLNRYDYTDMLSAVADALSRDDDLRLDLAERYHYVLVDEHQDTNRLQNRIIRLIAESSGQPNLFVVGDLEQAIYRFQGASPENFREFAARYRGCRVIRLDENYRSTQTILDAARGISPGQGVLAAHAGHRQVPVMLCPFSSPGAMERGIAGLVRDTLAHGVRPGDVAVLYRTNREADALVDAFHAAGIPCAVRSDQGVLGDRDIIKLLTVAEAARDIGRDAPLLAALQVDFMGVSPLDAAKIGHAAFRRRMSAWDLIRSPRALRSLALESPRAVSAACTTLKELARIIANTDAARGFNEVVGRTGWLAYAVSRADGDELIAKLHAVTDAVRDFQTGTRGARLADFLEMLERLRRHETDLAALTQPREDLVQLMTAHKAKGLEFDTVIISNAVRGHWDDARRPVRLTLPAAVTDDEPDGDDDVRRLFYVAATRAKRHLVLAWPRRTADGRDQQPSRFVLAIPESLRTTVDTSALERTRVPDRRVRTRPAMPALRRKEFIADVLERQPLSVTALNNYLDCPWRYYFTNLVRIPQAPSPKLEYGTAAHEAARRFFQKLAAGGHPGRTFLTDAFRTALKRAPVSATVVAQLEADGVRALAGWHDQWRSSWVRDVLCEVAIERVTLAPGIHLTGKLDKVELLPDGRVDVVDYKTRRPMSANEIRGITKNSTGNEYRQLLFYRLLLDRWQNGRWKMAGGQIDFLEPNERGIYKKETFPISADMTEPLRNTIIETVGHIKRLDFWDTRCGERGCTFCGLRDLME